jgi:NADH:ubiquinone oxidoreductase subunit E
MVQCQQLNHQNMPWEEKMGTILVEVCVGTHCTMLGAMNIIDAVHSLDEIRQSLGDACEDCTVEVKAISCLNLCKNGENGPFVKVDGQLISQAESESVMAAIMESCRHPRCQNE